MEKPEAGSAAKAIYPQSAALAACTDLKREHTQQGAGMPNLVRMLVSS